MPSEAPPEMWIDVSSIDWPTPGSADRFAGWTSAQRLAEVDRLSGGFRDAAFRYLQDEYPTYSRREIGREYAWRAWGIRLPGYDVLAQGAIE